MALLPSQRPDNPSADYNAMLEYWTMVETMLNGTQAMRLAGQKYLPKFPNETDADYQYRRNTAKFTNIYRDIIENLAAKPFAKELTLKDENVSPEIETLCEDIDGQGNNLHVFASRLFFAGISDAISWIFIDKQPTPENTSRAAERQMGIRPYWIHIPAKRLLAVYSAIIDGTEQIVHARIHEPEVVRTEYTETVINRVRELNRDELGDGAYGPPRFTLWEQQQPQGRGDKEWVIVSEGIIAFDQIALVPFITGRRKESTWVFEPPMQDAAYLQIEHFQQESNLKSVKEQAAFPMLSGNGVSPPTDQAGKPVMVPVGPKAVLFAPPSPDGRSNGQWNFIEPSGQTLTFLSNDIKATEEQMRELGRQPLTAQSGNLTVITTAFAASKGNSAIQAWALNLKDALEQALAMTARWLGENVEPEVNVFTDFALDIENQAAPNFLLSMRQSKDISRVAIINEAKRRGFLSPEYDADEDMQNILQEQPTAQPNAQDVANALGNGGPTERDIGDIRRFIEDGEGLEIIPAAGSAD